MSQKFIIELDDCQMEYLNDFQQFCNCKHRVDAVRLLVDLLKPLERKFDLVSVGEKGISFLKDGRIVHINKKDSPDVKAMSMLITYEGEGNVHIKKKIIE